MGDLVERAAVLAFIESDHEMSLRELREGIAALPTAEPERADVASSRGGGISENELQRIAAETLSGTLCAWMTIPTSALRACYLAGIRVAMLTEARARPLSRADSAIKVRAMAIHAALWRAMNDTPENALASLRDDGYLHKAVHAMFDGPGADDFDAATKAHVEDQDRRIERLEEQVRRVPALVEVARRAEALLLARDEDMTPRDEHAQKLGEALDALEEVETDEEHMARLDANLTEARAQPAAPTMHEQQRQGFAASCAQRGERQAVQPAAPTARMDAYEERRDERTSEIYYVARSPASPPQQMAHVERATVDEIIKESIRTGKLPPGIDPAELARRAREGSEDRIAELTAPFRGVVSEPAADGEFAGLLRELDEWAQPSMRPACGGRLYRQAAAALRKVLGEKQEAERWKVLGEKQEAERWKVLGEKQEAERWKASVTAHVEREAKKCGFEPMKIGDAVNAMSRRLRDERQERKKAEADLAREREAHEETRRTLIDAREDWGDCIVERDAARAEVERLKAELDATLGDLKTCRTTLDEERRDVDKLTKENEGLLDMLEDSRAEADRLRAQLEAMPNYARAIGEIEAAVGVVGDVPLSDTVAAVKRLRAQLEPVGTLHVAAEPEPRVTQGDVTEERAARMEAVKSQHERPDTTWHSFDGYVAGVKGKPVAEGRACPVTAGTLEYLREGRSEEVCDFSRDKLLAWLHDEVRRLGGGGR